jgi:putative endonuclease
VPVTGDRKELGMRGEDEATRLLKNKGYKILDRNYRCRFGEIDIVAREGDTIAFVEVKTRGSEDFGSPKEALDTRKRRHITRASMDYLNRHRRSGDAHIRFDVVTVEKKGDRFVLELIKNAFEAEE